MQSQKILGNLTQKVWILALIIVGITLTWLIITRSFVAHFAKSSPETALRLRAVDAVALVNSVGHALSSQKNKKKLLSEVTEKTKTQDNNTLQLEKLTKQALQDSPLNPKALRLLGQISAKNKDLSQTQDYMEAALQLSKREDIATYWLMQNAYQKRNYPLTLIYAEILLAHRPSLIKNVMPMLVMIAENQDQPGLLKPVLAKKPIWRRMFFARLPQTISRFKTPLTLLTNLKNTSAPPTKPEILYYINFLLRNKKYDLAYYSWLQFLSNEELSNTTLLFNGHFKIALDSLPFNWVIKKGAGTHIDLVTNPNNDKEKILRILLNYGRSNFQGITQITMLTPGFYELEGYHKGRLIGRRGLRWQVTCLGKHKLLAQSAMFMGRKTSWKPFKVSFTIPEETNCIAQRVSLMLDARTTSEKLVSGQIWYKSLKISRK